VNTIQKGPSRSDTADFNDQLAAMGAGNLRADYVLPSKGLRPDGAGVFWPKAYTPFARLSTTSDHHLVWLDLHVTE